MQAKKEEAISKSEECEEETEEQQICNGGGRRRGEEERTKDSQDLYFICLPLLWSSSSSKEVLSKNRFARDLNSLGRPKGVVKSNISL